MSEVTTLLKVGSATLVLEMIEAGRAVPRLHPGQPDPGHPRDQPRPDRPAHRPPRGRAGGQRAGHPARVPRPGRRARRTRGSADPTIAARARAVGPHARRRREPEPVADRPRDRLGDQAPARRALPAAQRARPGQPARSPSSTWPTTTSAAGRGLFDLLQRKGMVDRVTDDGEIEAAKDTPPQTTRAKLRGDFIAAAQAAGRDFTVDWVHLKLNDQAQRTVLCKDPFRAVDERVDRLIASPCNRRPALRPTSSLRLGQHPRAHLGQGVLHRARGHGSRRCGPVRCRARAAAPRPAPPGRRPRPAPGAARCSARWWNTRFTTVHGLNVSTGSFTRPLPVRRSPEPPRRGGRGQGPWCRNVRRAQAARSRPVGHGPGTAPVVRCRACPPRGPSGW